MIIMNEKGHLTSQTIDEWSAEAETLYTQALKGKQKPSHTVRLGLEETLLRFREKYGTDEECNIKCYKNGHLLRFVISQRGDHSNPLNIDEFDLSYDLLEKFDLKPRYTYKSRRRLNVVTFPINLPPRKNTLLIRLGIAVILAILTKLLLSVLPDSVGSGYIQPAISELFQKMTFIFGAVATPLVFCAVINGINGLDDVVSFGKVGTRLLRRMMFTYIMAMFIMVGIGSTMGLVSASANSTGKNVFSDLLALVLDMIPNNLVEPFVTDNDLQVIVLSIFVGVIMLILGEKVSHVRTFISELGDLVNKMMLTICKLMPLFVYLGISDLILSDRLKSIYKVSMILIISLVGAALVILITCIRTKIVTKLPFKDILSPQIPSLIINLTTSSQVSALPESIKCCKEKYHINPKMVDFGLPFGIVIYMPNGAIMLGSMAWVLNVMNNGPVSIGTVINIAFVAMVVAIAAPPIPGSAFAVMPILFSACGTDLSTMPLAVIVASTVGYLLPAMNGFCLQQELLMSAWKSNMIEKESEA